MRRAWLALAFLCALPAHAATYYVDPVNGTDQLSCRTTPGPGAAACRTITYIFNNLDLAPNDVVNVAAGTLYEKIEPGSDDVGTSGNPILIQGAGIAQTAFTGITAAASLNDAAALDCANGANGCPSVVSGVYRFTGVSTSIMDVVETSWTSGRVRLDDRLPADGGQCNQASCSYAVYDFERAPLYTNVPDFTSVSNVEGSWTRSGTDLYVRMWDNENPATAGRDIEVITRSPVVEFQTNRNYITLQDLTIRYCNQCVYLSYTTGVTFNRTLVHSSNGNMSALTPTNLTVTNSTFDASQQRELTFESGTTSTPTDKGEGWYANAQGSNIGVQGVSGADLASVTFRDNLLQTGWNVFGCDDCTNSIFERNLIRNTPNHNFLLSLSGGTCTGNVIRENIIVNGQDGIYLDACSSTIVQRNASQLTQTNQSGSASNVKSLSNLYGWFAQDPSDPDAMGVPAGTTTGWVGNYDFLSTLSVSGCNWAGTTYTCAQTGAGTQFPDACSCEANALHAASVQLAGFTWMPSNGLALSARPRSDFYPAAGSAVIDAGSPDIDGDGVIETGPGGDDECTVAHHCYGSAPDIGPFEWGIDVPAGGGGPRTRRMVIVR